jgi:2-dehydropantoate 2-reductase
MAMQTVVVGAGAMGSVYGAMFSKAGHDVTFLEVNPATVKAIKAHGLRIRRQDGEVTTYEIDATSDPASLSEIDLALFQVKGFATAAAARSLRPSTTAETVVMTLQNGLGNEDTLREVFPANPLLLGTSVHSVTTVGPAEYHHTGVRETHIGPSRDEWSEIAKRIVGDLATSGYEFNLETSDEIHRQVFAKWVLNCGSLPVLSVTGLETRAVNNHPEVLQICDEITREACRLAAAEGYPLDADERVAYNRSLFTTAGGKASMLQDIEAGRRTEIDTINGAAVRLADKHGLPAPLNRALFALVKGREAAMSESP